MIGTGRNNLLRLVRMGLLSPSLSEKEIHRTMVYALWKEFRGVCLNAKVESLTPPTINCRLLQGLCELAACPIIQKVLDRFERSIKHD